ncbi:MAG: 2-oxoacid:ferredoxin oxidoreductase subunit beta [Planctomycetes bacterium]|nr:2-oxoacid:ferredoxin oxidoreductase subunit beta [Planctomycetota bacterium]
MSETKPASSAVLDLPSYTRQDFTSDQIVRWCPGCGDYSILAQMQKVMPAICQELRIPKEKIVFVSGIGCSSRFPYYMDTYGFHGIHGRAPTIASGIKISNPDLQVWVVTGDGDGLSIGGNHLIHCLRRNLDIKILLFNNRIYGLTKGQYSPTSELGKKTKSSPFGTLEQPINPLCIALAAEATFVARAIATDSAGLQDIIMRAARHKGSAFVEIFQNCNVFNDGAFDHFADKSVRDEKTLTLEHGKPLIFGKARDQAILLQKTPSGVQPRRVKVGEVPETEILVHDEKSPSPILAYIIAHLEEPEFPVPLGVFRSVAKPTYEGLLSEQIDSATKALGKGDLNALLSSGDTWEVHG